MTSSRPPHAVSLAASSSDAPLSKDQKAFNTLVMQIGQRRELLGAWERASADFHPVFAQELMPLRSSFQDLSRALILKLDAQFGHEKLTSSDRQAVSSLILAFLGEHESDLATDAQLKSIYNRHCGSDFDQEVAFEAAELKADLEQMFGESLGDDDDMTSPEEVMQRARAKMAEHAAREAAKKDARAQRKAERAGPAKTDAASARREEARAELTQSLRDIYRKLASALHPDREPDPELRIRKTGMMQALNQAYEKQDLLHLLQLQLELQQVDQHALNDLGDARLKQYNKLLKEQLSELDQELLLTEDRFMGSYGILSPQRLTPAGAVQFLRGEIRRTQDDIDAITNDLAMFADIKLFKRWLKDTKKSMRAAYADETMGEFRY